MIAFDGFHGLLVDSNEEEDDLLFYGCPVATRQAHPAQLGSETGVKSWHPSPTSGTFNLAKCSSE